MPLPPLLARTFAQGRLDAETLAHVDAIHMPGDAGHGFDPFGLHRDFVKMGLAITMPIYKRYFRVESFGTENIPKTGPGVLAANHSGTVPTDGMMLWTDVVLKASRVPRPIADHFVPALPVIGTFFARGGMVGGSRGNARALLSAGELLMIFPEGTPGIGKHFRDRYKLQKWRVGHAELAMRHGAPVIPVAFVGPEEQMPQVARIDVPAMGLPYVPIPATPLPLPVKYRIHYGKPVPIDRDYRPSDADDPDAVAEAAERVGNAVQALIDEGLRLRGGRLFT
ncbi:MAG: acyltransferase family protein [Proteobacteria bacterium]|nr:acyltransferase family protein [Pseudomonadota bacterium]MCP4920482.1 acyltransferase family protein [Pseudomonadota bacterium]